MLKPEAESTIDSWLFSQACRYLAHWLHFMLFFIIWSIIDLSYCWPAWIYFPQTGECSQLPPNLLYIIWSCCTAIWKVWVAAAWPKYGSDETADNCAACCGKKTADSGHIACAIKTIMIKLMLVIGLAWGNGLVIGSIIEYCADSIILWHPSIISIASWWRAILLLISSPVELY